MIHRQDIAEVIAEKTLHHTDSAKLHRSVAAYLLEQNLVADIDSLMRDVMKYRAQKGYLEATVVSAFPMSAVVNKDVLKLLKEEYPEAKHIQLNERIDPDVVGGILIEAAGEELDLTVRAKLNMFKRLTSSRAI